MTVAIIIFTAISTIYGCYFGIIALIALIHGRKPRQERPPKYKIAALIAARNEENVVAQAVESIRKQRYPAELTGVFVAVNNCTDDTEGAALRAGAQVIRCEGDIRSKGDALRFAFDRLLKTDYDAYVILDADNLADPDFFAQVNVTLDSGYRIAQGYRDSKNAGDNWVAGCASIFYWFMSSLYNRARDAGHMSCWLNGTGFMVSASLLRETGWQTGTLTEDLEYTAQCALKGEKIGWMEYARVYDDQPTTLWDSLVQRKRWFAGSLQCFHRYFIPLLKKHTHQCLDNAIVFSGTMLQWMSLIPLAFSIIFAYQMGGWPGVLYSLLFGCGSGAVGITLGAWIICALEKVRFPGKWKSICTFCIYLFTWMPANLSVFVTGIPKWKMIPHKPAPKDHFSA